MKARLVLVGLVMLVVSIAVGSASTASPAEPAVTTSGAVTTAGQAVEHVSGAGSPLDRVVTRLAAPVADHARPCLERAECAGAFAGAALMVALVLAAVVTAPLGARRPIAAPSSLDSPVGRLLIGGIFRPPREES